MRNPIKINKSGIKLSPREQQLKDDIVSFVTRNWENAQDLFDQAAEKNPIEAMKILISLTEFVAPKYAKVKMVEEQDKHTDIVVTFQREEIIDSSPKQID